MGEPLNEKPFSSIAFTLLTGARQQYETSQGACIYFAEGGSVGPGQISIQFDEWEAFRVSPGQFIRVKRFDKVRIINNSNLTVSGVFHVSSDPDFLMLFYPSGI